MEVKKKKKRSSAKTLDTARKAGYFGKKMADNASTAAEQGRPVVWSMMDFWFGYCVAKTFGLELVYPENYGALSASLGGAEPYLEYAYSDGFPTTTCGYARNTLGYARKLKENNYVIPPDAPGGGMPKPIFLLACGALCDARYKMFQALGRYMDVPVWMLEFPQSGIAEYFSEGYKEDNIIFMVQELHAFVSFLEGITQKKMDWDNLSERVDTMIKTHRLAYEIDLLRRAVPSPMVSTDFWALMVLHFYFPDDREALVFYQQVYDEVKYKVDNKIAAVPGERYRMMFADLPPWHSLGIFDEFAEKHKIAFVIESMMYHAAPPLPEGELDKVHDPLEICARFAYHWMNAYAPVAREFDIEPTLFTSAYPQWAKDYRVDGTLLHSLLSCRPATYTLLHIRNILEKRLRVPSVVMEGDIVDLRVFNEDEIHRKMDVFIETMDYYRELREKEGFPW